MAWIYHNKPPMGWPLDLSEPINEGLVGYWLANEGSGNIIQDLSGNGNIGTLVADAHFVAAKFGPGVDFDGTGDYINCGTVPQIFGTSKLSILFWVKLKAYVGVGAFVSSWDAGGNRRFLTREDGSGNLTFFTFTSGSASGSFLNIPLGIWTMVVLTYDGVTMRGYKNGVVSSTTVAQTGSLQTGGEQDVYIANDPGGSGLPHNAVYDHVSIYNCALSDSKIALLYRFPFYGFLNPDEIPVLDQYYTVAPVGNAGIMTTNTGFWGPTF